jgi:hypothetical protein
MDSLKRRIYTNFDIDEMAEELRKLSKGFKELSNNKNQAYSFLGNTDAYSLPYLLK